jgi:5-hydroxyisourate hydrolase-like protein (transthyretin family)
MSENGRLTVRVYTSQAQIPVEGATVVVTQTETDGKYRLLSVQVTDDSGQIAPIVLPTPPAAESESPDASPTGQSFTLCDVWAEHPGFAMLRVEGVQIFSGVETSQGMELIPLGEGESSLSEQDVRPIPAQNL